MNVEEKQSDSTSEVISFTQPIATDLHICSGQCGKTLLPTDLFSTCAFCDAPCCTKCIPACPCHIEIDLFEASLTGPPGSDPVVRLDVPSYEM
jgi:hypothetical protein